MRPLFADDLVLVTLGSGSKGNATYIGDGRRGVLIDCGISTKQIWTRLAAAGLPDAPIDAVLVTHEHTDHVAAAAVLGRDLARRNGSPVPFFMTRGTHRGIRRQIRPDNVEIVRAGTPVRLKGWTLEPHAVPHDTPSPVAWAVDAEGVRAGVLTDLGHAPKSAAALLRTLDLAVVEFNHDERMLMEGSYPWPLKQRIRGPYGHLSNRQAARLSNRQAARLLLAARPERLRHLVLAHLSEENNTPTKALEAAHAALDALGRRDIAVQVGEQRQPTRAVRAAVDGALPLPKPRRRSARRKKPAAPATPELWPTLFPAK